MECFLSHRVATGRRAGMAPNSRTGSIRHDFRRSSEHSRSGRRPDYCALDSLTYLPLRCRNIRIFLQVGREIPGRNRELPQYDQDPAFVNHKKNETVKCVTVFGNRVSSLLTNLIPRFRQGLGTCHSGAWHAVCNVKRYEEIKYRFTLCHRDAHGVPF